MSTGTFEEICGIIVTSHLCSQKKQTSKQVRIKRQYVPASFQSGSVRFEAAKSLKASGAASPCLWIGEDVHLKRQKTFGRDVP